jgi:hypothetical protein
MRLLWDVFLALPWYQKILLLLPFLAAFALASFSWLYSGTRDRLAGYARARKVTRDVVQSYSKDIEDLEKRKADLDTEITTQKEIMSDAKNDLLIDLDRINSARTPQELLECSRQLSDRDD